jgi:hypothetical protein
MVLSLQSEKPRIKKRQAVKGRERLGFTAESIIIWRGGIERQIRYGLATEYIEKLKRGETVRFQPRGNSMTRS